MVALLLVAFFGTSMELSKTYFTKVEALKFNSENTAVATLNNSKEAANSKSSSQILENEALDSKKEFLEAHKKQALTNHEVKQEQPKEESKPVIATENVSKDVAISSAMWYPKNKGKVVYLTFDDGPSQAVTPLVLDVLKKYNVKGTFFVLGSLCEENPQLIKREINDGNAVCNHSYSHIYTEIYKDPQSFKNEMEKTASIIKLILGQNYNPRIIRMPGGSAGKDDSFKIATFEMGCQYVDWNCLSRDSEGKDLTVEEEVLNVKETSMGKNSVIVLMHDAGAKKNTALALPQVIEYFISQGYSFEVIN